MRFTGAGWRDGQTGDQLGGLKAIKQCTCNRRLPYFNEHANWY